MPPLDDSTALMQPLVSLKEILHHNALTILTRLVLLLPPMQIIFRRRVEHVEEPFPLIAHLEHARHVPTPVAVIWRAPHRAQPIIVQHLIPLLTELVRAQDVVHPVDLEELLHHLRAKRVAGAAGREGEFVALRVRVAPDEVGHGALVRDLAEAVDDLDLVDAVDGGAEAAVHAEDLVRDDDGEGEEVEHVGEVVPHVGVAVLAVAFRVEAVGLRHAARFVVAADQVHARGVAELEADEEGDCFDGEEAAVYVIAWMREGVSDGKEAFLLSTRAPLAIAYPGISSWCPDRSLQF